MSSRLGRLCLGLSVAAVAVSCGTTPPTRPGITQTKKIVAHQLAPNVMVLVDRSSQMTINTSVAAPCPSTIGACGPGNPCPAGCPTRLDDVKTALGGVLNARGTTLRVGMSVFPADNACGPANPNSVLVPLLGPQLSDDTQQLQAQAQAAQQSLGTVSPQGGTATVDSLRFIGQQTELADNDRQNFVMLFTSGVPDCNATTADAVSAVNDLRAKTIKTIVLAIGPDALTPAATDTLNQIAVAGGVARACPMGTDAECGALDTCNATTKTCGRAFFSAADAQGLTQQLMDLTASAPTGDVCSVLLEKAPADLAHLEVLVDGAPLASCASASGCNTWTFDAANNTVQFQGATCTKLENGSPIAPVTLTFHIFE